MLYVSLTGQWVKKWTCNFTTVCMKNIIIKKNTQLRYIFLLQLLEETLGIKLVITERTDEIMQVVICPELQ